METLQKERNRLRDMVLMTPPTDKRSIEMNNQYRKDLTIIEAKLEELTNG